MRRVRLRLVLLVAVLCLAVPCAAAASCGNPKRAYPSKWSRDYRPPLVIGDSVMLNAVGPLAGRGFQVDARGCRMWREGMQVLRARGKSLPRLVVMALGANWVISSGDIEGALKILGRERVLALVTPRETGGAVSSDTYNVRRAGRRHRNRVKVVDWVAASAGRGSYFAGDGLHLSWSGVNAYTRLIAQKAFPWRLGWRRGPLR